MGFQSRSKKRRYRRAVEKSKLESTRRMSLLKHLMTTLHITLSTSGPSKRAVALLQRLLSRSCFRDVTITTRPRPSKGAR